MKTFKHWRAVGRAMRWARRQRMLRTLIAHEGRVTEMAWHHEGNLVAFHDTGGGQLGLYVDLLDGAHLEADDLTAMQVLGVLNGLGLIPAELVASDDMVTSLLQAVERITGVGTESYVRLVDACQRVAARERQELGL